MSDREGPSVSKFEAVVKRRADRLGKSIKQLLEDDRAALHQSRYPSPECLTPSEIDLFGKGDLQEDRIAHVEECAICAALLDAARTTSELSRR